MYRVSQAGDTIENMVYGTAICKRTYRPKSDQLKKTLNAVKDHNPDCFLFSGGGNDISGENLEALLNHHKSGINIGISENMMRNFYRLIDHPLIIYSVMVVFSMVAAFSLWMIGGNFAKVVSSNATIGLTMELGGAIAGFSAVFFLSYWVFERLRDTRPPLQKTKVFLNPPNRFPASGNYSCTVWIYDQDVGEERKESITPRREAGYLTVDLLDLKMSERYRIEIRDNQNGTWRSDYYPVAAAHAEMQPI